MKTVEVSNQVAQEIEDAKHAASKDILVEIAKEFLDVTSVDTPLGERHLYHAMTGKKLTVRADWDD